MSLSSITVLKIKKIYITARQRRKFFGRLLKDRCKILYFFLISEKKIGFLNVKWGGSQKVQVGGQFGFFPKSGGALKKVPPHVGTSACVCRQCVRSTASYFLMFRVSQKLDNYFRNTIVKKTLIVIFNHSFRDSLCLRLS